MVRREEGRKEGRKEPDEVGFLSKACTLWHSRVHTATHLEKVTICASGVTFDTIYLMRCYRSAWLVVVNASVG